MLQRKEREGKPQHLIIADQVGLTSDMDVHCAPGEM
jgi:hypothetical protein